MPPRTKALKAFTPPAHQNGSEGVANPDSPVSRIASRELGEPIAPIADQPEDGTTVPPSRESLAVQPVDGTKVPSKLGRPRTVDRHGIGLKVLRRVSSGDSLRNACRNLGIRPARFLDWVREDDILASQYARAREAQAHHLAERAIAVSRKAMGRDTAGVQAARLEVDTIKWYTAKLYPKFYGERQFVEDEGEKVFRVVFEQSTPPGLRQAVDAEFEVTDG
jgi:hypothetical protein